MFSLAVLLTNWVRGADRVCGSQLRRECDQLGTRKTEGHIGLRKDEAGRIISVFLLIQLPCVCETTRGVVSSYLKGCARR